MPPPPEPLRRSLRFERSELNPDTRTLELSASSDTDQVTRWVSGYGYVREILSHEPGALDYSRFEGDRGGPCLYNHDFRQLIGRFHHKALEGGKWRGTIRFATSEEGEKRYQEALEDVLVDVSITYDYDPKDVEVVERDAQGKPTSVRVKRWTAYEVSMVTVPADSGVGVGRSHNPAASVADKMEERMPPEGTTTPSAPAVPTPTTPPVNVAEVRAQAVKAEGERTAQILALADQFGVKPEKRSEWIGQGATVDQVRAEILEGYKSSKPLPGMSEQIGMNDKERSRYSVARAIQALADRNLGLAGLEKEASDAVAKKFGRSTGGLFIPSDVQFRAANTMNTGAAGAGQELVQKDYMGFLEMLKNEAIVLQLGARVISGLQGNPTWVKQTGASSVYWVGENPGADATDSKLGFGLVTATPKTAKSLLTYTRQQLAQSVEAFEPLVQADMLENDGLAMDAAALVGTGSSFQPTGLLNTAGIGALPLGTNGAVPTYRHLTALKTLVKKANALKLGAGGYLTTPDIQDLLENTAKLANTMAQAIWENDKVAGFRAASANQVPANLTKGTAAAICHAIVFGIWSELFILEWGALEMQVDPYTLMGQDVVRVSTSHILDIFVRRPQAFAAIKDALSA